MNVVRWGLIGAGDIARKRIAPALRDLANCDLVSVARSQAELAESFAAEFGAKKWFGNWRELVHDSDIDAVYIATPVNLHKEQTIAAAEAGKHILCEKPMALNVQECDEMIRICRQNNVKLGIAYYRRFYPAIERVREIIRSGEIGKVTIAQINAFEYFDPSPENPRRWLIDKEKSGGGPMMDFGCHRLEVLTHLFGTPGRTQSIVSRNAFDRGVEDTASVLLQFDGGTTATLTVTHTAIEPQDTLDIFGTKGSIHIPVLNQGEMTIKVGSDERNKFHPPAANVHQPLIENFDNSILHDRQPAVDGETGRRVAMMTEEIYANGG